MTINKYVRKGKQQQCQHYKFNVNMLYQHEEEDNNFVIWNFWLKRRTALYLTLFHVYIEQLQNWLILIIKL